MKYSVKIALVIYLAILVRVLFVGVGTLERDSHFVNPNDHFMPLQSTFIMLKEAHTYDFRGNPMFFLILNIIGNLALLAPWGLLAPLVFEKLNNFRSLVFSAFLISFSAETIQYVFSIGIFDIDDLIFNTIGGGMGFLALQIGQRYLGLPERVRSNSYS